MHRRQPVHRRRDAFHARLELQRKGQRVVARLHEIAAVEPQTRLPRRLPHVAQLPLPGARVVLRVRAQTPALADALGHLGRNQLCRPVVHRPVAGRQNDEVGRQLDAVGQRHRAPVDPRDRGPASQLDSAVDDQLRGAHLDVVTAAAPQIGGMNACVVLAEVVQEARALEPGIEVRVALADLVVNRALQRGQNPERNRGGGEIGDLGADARAHGLLGIQAAPGVFHQGFGAHHDRGRALHHRDFRSPVLPEVGADVVRRIVRAEHHAALARPGLAAGVPARVAQRALEGRRAGNLGNVRHARHARGQHQLLGPQAQRLPVAAQADFPLRRRLVVARAGAFRAGPVIELHDPGVHLQPVAHLVLG